MKRLNSRILGVQAGFIAWFLAQGAEAAVGTPGNSFGTVARNITDSIEELPGLLTSISYILGLVLGVLGIMKVKDHIENPTQTPMKEGVVRIAAGGALFALPIIMEAMLNTMGTTGVVIKPAVLSRALFNVQ